MVINAKESHFAEFTGLKNIGLKIFLNYKVEYRKKIYGKRQMVFSSNLLIQFRNIIHIHLLSNTLFK